MLVLKNVSKSFGRSTVLRDVSFRIDPGEFVCITGPSGAGKSTLIRLLTGAEPVSGGGVSIDGVDLRLVPPPVLQIFRRRVGIVFQDRKLLGDRTVRENISFPLEVCGVPDAIIAQRVSELMRAMDLLKAGAMYPRELSGGEQARTAIARAVVHKPMILLADEPTGNIDPDQSAGIMRLFADIHRKGTTVIVATHDAGLVDALRTRVIRLEEGRVVRDSFGGYGLAKGKDEEDRPKQHRIFQDAPVGLVAKETWKDAEPDARRQGKKIKVTAIGG